jgi:hypothetical protein
MRRPSAAKIWHLCGFVLTLMVETLGRRRLSRVLAQRLGSAPLAVGGLDAVPARGPFVLAVNHHRAGATMQVVAAAVLAAARARPDVADACALVIGQRTGARRWARAIAAAVFRRWARNVIRVPTHNEQPSLASLRAWRRRVAEQPVLVFPEGRAAPAFGDIRPGAGRWLASLKAPILPVAVWPHEGGFRVELGHPMEWAKRAELHDLQLGLAIAAMLPAELAPAWQETLARWREVHEGRATARAGADRAGS